MKIISNGSKWYGDAPDSIDRLLVVLKEETLDPTFEHYGNFILQLDERGFIRVWGNFLRYSHVFSIDGTITELWPIIDAITENQNTDDYRANKVTN